MAAPARLDPIVAQLIGLAVSHPRSRSAWVCPTAAVRHQRADLLTQALSAQGLSFVLRQPFWVLDLSNGSSIDIIVTTTGDRLRGCTYSAVAADPSEIHGEAMEVIRCLVGVTGGQLIR